MTIGQIIINDPFFAGFERAFDKVNTASRIANPQQKYPPYNIIKTDENTYLIELAVAGFNEDDFDIELHDGILTVKGNITTSSSDSEYIHRGIASRSFERNFALVDTMNVDDISLKQGMLRIRLVNIVPDEKKPRKFQISKPSERQLLNE